MLPIRCKALYTVLRNDDIHTDYGIRGFVNTFSDITFPGALCSGFFAGRSGNIAMFLIAIFRPQFPGLFTQPVNASRPDIAKSSETYLV